MFFRLIDHAEEAIISLLLVCMTLLVFTDVVLRFGFNAGMIWSEELTLHMSAWFVLFGAAYGLKVGAHIGVDALVRTFSPFTQRVVTGIAIILSLVYCGLFIYGAWIYLAKMKKIGIELEDLPIQAWIAHSILLIGFVLLGIRSARAPVEGGHGQGLELRAHGRGQGEPASRRAAQEGGGAAMTIATLFILLFGCMLIGMPIAISLGFSSVVTILLFSNDFIASIALKLFEALSGHAPPPAIPFFILSSAFLSTGGVARRLIRFAIDLVGHIRGGLAMASILACMLFAAVSGSSPATVAAIGTIVITGMVRSGYPKSLAAGTITTAEDWGS